MVIIGLSSIVAVCFTGRNFLFLSELRKFQATSFRGSDRNLRLKIKKKMVKVFQAVQVPLTYFQSSYVKGI